MATKKKKSKSKSKTTKKADKPSSPMIKCQVCKAEKALIKKNFFSSQNPMYQHTGYVPICKACVNKAIINEYGYITEKTFRPFLKKVDRVYSRYVFELTASLGYEPDKFLGQYIRRMLITNINGISYRKLKYEDSERIAEVEKVALAELRQEIAYKKETLTWDDDANEPDTAVIVDDLEIVEIEDEEKSSQEVSQEVVKQVVPQVVVQEEQNNEPSAIVTDNKVKPTTFNKEPLVTAQMRKFWNMGRSRDITDKDIISMQENYDMYTSKESEMSHKKQKDYKQLCIYEMMLSKIQYDMDRLSQIKQLQALIDTLSDNLGIQAVQEADSFDSGKFVLGLITRYHEDIKKKPIRRWIEDFGGVDPILNTINTDFIGGLGQGLNINSEKVREALQSLQPYTVTLHELEEDDGILPIQDDAPTRNGGEVNG